MLYSFVPGSSTPSSTLSSACTDTEGNVMAERNVMDEDNHDNRRTLFDFCSSNAEFQIEFHLLLF